MPGIERFGSGGPWEARVGYSRVVRAGDHVHVSGCTAVGPAGEVVGGADVYLQARQALENVAAALAMAGATVDDVVRTRVYLTDATRWEDAGRAHGEVFSAIRPANTMLEVSALIDPRLLVEVEADAWSPRS